MSKLEQQQAVVKAGYLQWMKGEGLYICNRLKSASRQANKCVVMDSTWELVEFVVEFIEEAGTVENFIMEKLKNTSSEFPDAAKALRHHIWDLLFQKVGLEVPGLESEEVKS